MGRFSLGRDRGVSDDDRVRTGRTELLDEELDRGVVEVSSPLAAVGLVLALVGGVAARGATGTLGVTTGSASPAVPVGLAAPDSALMVGFESELSKSSLVPVKVLEIMGRTPLVWEDEAE